MLEIEEFVVAGVTVALAKNQIVCFVGPNSVGKSSALSSINSLFHSELNERLSSVSAVKIRTDFTPDELERTLYSRMTHLRGGEIKWYGGGAYVGQGITRERLFESCFGAGDVNLSGLRGLFLTTIGAEARFSAVGPAPQINYLLSPPQHPLQALYLMPEKERRVSDISRSLFRRELSLNPGAGSHLTLHVGPRVDANDYGGDRTQEYANAIMAYPQIEVEGDGVRATVGLLCAAMASDVEVHLIDEPDLYLHPPQAYAVARVLAEEKSSSQLIFSTHSSRFIQGLADVAAERLTLIRLLRTGDQYSAEVVENSVFETINRRPILKFTSVIDALFFSNTVVAEDASDCLFLTFAMDRMGLGGRREDTYWIGANGKGNIAQIVSALLQLKVRPLVAADFDLLRVPRDIEAIVRSQGFDPAAVLVDLAWLSAQVSNNRALDWEAIKRTGLNALAPFPDLHARAMQILTQLARMRVVVNPFGETESLRTPRVGSHGPEAINAMVGEELEAMREYENARLFVADLAAQLA